jgi:hypothetical protein
MKLYGLKDTNTGQLLGVNSYSTADGEFCGDVAFVFTRYFEGDIPWLIESRDKAEYARTHDTQWYNAGYSTPQHFGGMKADDYEIFEVNIS